MTYAGSLQIVVTFLDGEKELNKLTKCCVKGCPGVCFVHSKVTDACTIKRIFEDKCLETEGNVPVPIPLCLHHYYMVYNIIQPQQTHCPTCGISLKHVPTRPCTNAELIGEHLRESAGFEGNL